MGIQEQIDRLEDQITGYNVRLNDLTELFMRDSRISPSEARRLEQVNARIRPLSARVDRLYERLDAENLANGEVIFRDDEALEVTVDTDEEFGEAKNFSDDYFKSRFRQSITDWTQDQAIGLNSISSYMNRQESPAGLGVTDLLPIMSLIFPASALVTAVVTLAPIVKAGFEQALRAARGSTPSLNEIHSAWMSGLMALRSANIDAQYDQFVRAWKSQEGIGNDVDQAWTNVFGPVCQGFANDTMPSASQIQKAFMGRIIETAQDGDQGPDWDDDAGDAELEVLELAQSWSSFEGELDDVSEAMLGAIQTVFARSRVIDLPVMISVIVRNVNGANMCEIQRTSKTPGNTDFSCTDGDRDKFDDFMSQSIYNRFYVRNLTLD